MYPLTKIRSGLYTYRGYIIECMDYRSERAPDDSNFGWWRITDQDDKWFGWWPTLKQAVTDINVDGYNEPKISGISYTYDDGGRKDAGYKGVEGDCVVRAVAIASGKPYRLVYDRIALGNKEQRKPRHKERKPVTGKYSVANGVYTRRKWFKDYMKELGFVWVPCVTIGSGCTTHLCAEELPKDGRYVLSLSKHYCALVDGEVRDTHNPSRGGTRCVYGYWELLTKL